MKICSRPLLLTLGIRLVHLLTSRPFSSTTSQIHVDRYKHSVYFHLSHEELSTVVTRDMSSTRFHACERFNRCEEVERLGKSVVYVNPAPMGSEDWGQYLNTTKEKLKYGEAVTSLVRRSTPYPISLSSYSSLALPCMETLAILGTASVRGALQTAQDYSKHPGPRSGKPRLDSDRQHVQGLPLISRQIYRGKHLGRCREKYLRSRCIRAAEFAGRVSS